MTALIPEIPSTVGQVWAYAPRDHATAADAAPASEIVVAAVVAFKNHDTVICCSVRGALQRQPDGTVKRADIPFLPLTEPAFRQTITTLIAANGSAVAGFQSGFDTWSKDPRGLSVFTVPFGGSLEKMIARQMQAIVQNRAA